MPRGRLSDTYSKTCKNRLMDMVDWKWMGDGNGYLFKNIATQGRSSYFILFIQYTIHGYLIKYWFSLYSSKGALSRFPNGLS